MRVMMVGRTKEVVVFRFKEATSLPRLRLESSILPQDALVVVLPTSHLAVVAEALTPTPFCVTSGRALWLRRLTQGKSSS